MSTTFQHAILSASGMAARVWTWAALLRAEPGLCLPPLVLLAALTIVFVGAGLQVSGHESGPQAAASAPAGQPQQDWAYLTVCGACGYRERTVERPVRLWHSKSGRLKCPKCGEYRATWYRRGSIVLPPGGW